MGAIHRPIRQVAIFGPTRSSGSQSLPKTGLILNLKASNAADDKYQATADDAALFAALGTPFWYATSASDPVARSAAEISAWAGINQYHVLWCNNRLAIYNPLTVPEDTLDKARRVMRQANFDDRPTAFFNGIDFTDLTSYTGGPTAVADNAGVVRLGSTDRPSIQGARVCRTIAEMTAAGVPSSTYLAGELVTNGDMSSATGWTTNSTTITGGVANVVASGSVTALAQTITAVIGRRYRLQQTITGYSGAGTITMTFGGVSAGARSANGSYETEIIATATSGLSLATSATAFTGTIDNVSVREVIPQYLDTASDGSPIFAASTSQATRTGTNATTEAAGAMLGVELVTNGDMSSATGWTLNSTTITGGVANVAASGAVTAMSQSTAAVAGRRYKLQQTISGYSGSGTITMQFGGQSAPARSANGTYTTEIVATTTGGLNLVTSATAFTGTLDNISIKEVIPTPVAPFASSTSFKKYATTNPALLPGWLCEPARTNYALNSATPATHTTGTVPAGTYTLWQEGSGSIVATAGTAVGTFGAASNGTPATITISTGGTVVLTASGTNTWVQLESGAFKTSRIATTTGSFTRQGTVLTYPTAGKIRANNMAFRMIVTPTASGQACRLFQQAADSNNYAFLQLTSTTCSVYKSVNASSATLGATSYSHVKDTAIEILFIQTVAGVQTAVRPLTGSWINGTLSTTYSAKANVPLATTYAIGSGGAAGAQFTGLIHHFDTLFIPDGILDPLAWAKKEWGLPA